jgi:hypothetical protein
MNYSINLFETIKVSEGIKTEMEIDAAIYRQEFERHRMEYLKSKDESELIFTFIFLQIYIECFFHQNMRKIIELEFKPPRDNVCVGWLAEEKRYVPTKIDNFVTIFLTPVSNSVQCNVDVIKDRFSKISSLRNLFAHGHKVAIWSDSDGNSNATPAKLSLSESQLIQSVTETNDLGLAWNNLLDFVLPQCKVLQRVDSFKFLNI